MTTKKDFIAAANTINAISDIKEKKTVCKNFIDIFSKQNPRFDSVKFSKACGL